MHTRNHFPVLMYSYINTSGLWNTRNCVGLLGVTVFSLIRSPCLALDTILSFWLISVLTENLGSANSNNKSRKHNNNKKLKYNLRKHHVNLLSKSLRSALLLISANSRKELNDNNNSNNIFCLYLVLVPNVTLPKRC